MSLNYIPTTQSMSGTSTGRNSPNDPSAAAPIKPPFGSSTSLNGAAGSIGSARLGAGSPSHELGARLFSKRYVVYPPGLNPRCNIVLTIWS
jgi:protein JSN1